MAYPTSDGHSFTNAPAARAHEARFKHSKKPKATPVMSHPHGKAADSDSGHDIEPNMVKCPHCGGDIDAHEILADRDPLGTDTPSTEF